MNQRRGGAGKAEGVGEEGLLPALTSEQLAEACLLCRGYKAHEPNCPIGRLEAALAVCQAEAGARIKRLQDIEGYLTDRNMDVEARLSAALVLVRATLSTPASQAYAERMKRLEEALSPDAVEKHIRALPWTKDATSDEKTLVAGNIRYFVAEAWRFINGAALDGGAVRTDG